MEQNTRTRAEQVSALADGQLRGDEFAQTMQWLAQSQEARGIWHAYHLAGDVLRSPELAEAATRDGDFVERLRSRLHDEGVMHHSETQVQATGSVGQAGLLSGRTGQSANESGQGWKLVAGLASVVAMAAIGWQLLAGLHSTGGSGQWAQTAESAVMAGQATGEIRQRMIRDPQLDRLLADHQQFGGTSALQMPAGFLRNATFERPAR